MLPRTTQPLIEIEDLNVQFVTSHGTVRAVEDLSYSVHPGEMVAIVGESGSGKSVSALAIMRLLPPGTARTQGSVRFDGRELLHLSEEEMRRIRGREIAMIFQEPMTSLNPVLEDRAADHGAARPSISAWTTAAARARAIELLHPGRHHRPPKAASTSIPHQLSGGMRQRVMIAIGLSCNPKLLIADEPTTALDVTIQAQILELMKDLSRRLGIAVVIITHNLGIVARYADRVNVMYAGAPGGERRRPSACSRRPLHPYARGLLRAVPRLDRGRAPSSRTIEGRRRTCSARPRAAASARAAGSPSRSACPIRRSRWASRDTWLPATAWPR